MFSESMMDISVSDVVVALCTLIGAFGGFPDPPPMFRSLTQSPLGKWALVWVLVYQGGGQQDLILTSLVVGAAYLVFYVVLPLVSGSSGRGGRGGF